MKKLACIVLTVILVAGFAFPAFAAEEPVDAYKLYKKAVEKMENEPVSMTGTMKTSISAGGESVDLNLLMIVRQLINSEGELEMSVATRSDFANIDQYYKNGYLYTNTDGVKTKSKLPDDFGAADANGVEADFSEENFKNAVVEVLPEGTMITVPISGEKMKEMVDSQMNGQQMDGVDELLGDLKYGDMSLSMLIDGDERIKKYRMAFEISFEDKDSGEILIKYDANLKVDPPNRFMKVEFPDDLVSYKAA